MPLDLDELRERLETGIREGIARYEKAVLEHRNFPGSRRRKKGLSVCVGEMKSALQALKSVPMEEVRLGLCLHVEKTELTGLQALGEVGSLRVRELSSVTLEVVSIEGFRLFAAPVKVSLGEDGESSKSE